MKKITLQNARTGAFALAAALVLPQAASWATNQGILPGGRIPPTGEVVLGKPEPLLVQRLFEAVNRRKSSDPDNKTGFRRSRVFTTQEVDPLASILDPHNKEFAAPYSRVQISVKGQRLPKSASNPEKARIRFPVVEVNVWQHRNGLHSMKAVLEPAYTAIFRHPLPDPRSRYIGSPIRLNQVIVRLVKVSPEVASTWGKGTNFAQALVSHIEQALGAGVKFFKR